MQVGRNRDGAEQRQRARRGAIPKFARPILNGANQPTVLARDKAEAAVGLDPIAQPVGRARMAARLEGSVEKTSREESEEYFRSRPLGSRLGAWTSSQSEVIANRAALESRLAEVTKQYEGADVPLPDHWGGYRVKPNSIEFWQGRTNRLHDRFRYTRAGEAAWRIERLSP